MLGLHSDVRCPLRGSAPDIENTLASYCLAVLNLVTVAALDINATLPHGIGVWSTYLTEHYTT